MLQTLYNLYAWMGWGSYILLFFLGLILGSFLNSWIWRTRENIKVLTTGRSVCFYCHRQLRWYENIPVISFIFLKRKCPACGNLIPWRYPLVEIGTACLLTLVGWYHVNFLPAFDIWWWLRDVFFITILIVIFVYDWLYQEVLASLVWLATVIGFLMNYYYHGFSVNNMVMGAFVAGGFFGLQYLISRGRWIGGGDVRLGFMIGVWLGWPNILVAIMTAYILGALIAIYLLATKKAKADTKLAFGTFLAIGTFFAIYHGEQMMNWYMKLIN